jgi:uncharacterized C2H2 Zn-finger protein
MGGYRCPISRCDAHLFQKKADLSEHLKDDHEWTLKERKSYLEDAEREESDGSSNDYTRTYNDTRSSSSDDDQKGGSKKRGGGGDGSYVWIEHKDDGSAHVSGYGPAGRNVVYNDDGKKAGKGK